MTERTRTEEDSERDAVERQLRTIWSDVLGIDDIRAEDCFVELGGDSLVASMCAERIRAAWDVDLATGLLLEEGFSFRDLVDRVAHSSAKVSHS